MHNHWARRLFNRSVRRQDLSASFHDHVREAIRLFSEMNADVDDAVVIHRLKDRGMNETEAREILIFLPIVFVRFWLPGVRWHDFYYEVNGSGEIRREYADDIAFGIVHEVAGEYFRNGPVPETIIKIGGRSAELNVINQLLQAGGKLEDVTLTPSYIIR